MSWYFKKMNEFLKTAEWLLVANHELNYYLAMQLFLKELRINSSGLPLLQTLSCSLLNLRSVCNS